MKKLFEHTGILEPFREIVQAPESVELVMREKGGKRWLFVLNYLTQEQTINLNRTLFSLLEQAETFGEITLPPYGVAVFAL